MSSYPPADSHLPLHLPQVSPGHLSPCSLSGPLHMPASDLSETQIRPCQASNLKPSTSLSSYVGQSTPSKAPPGLMAPPLPPPRATVFVNSSCSLNCTFTALCPPRAFLPPGFPGAPAVPTDSREAQCPDFGSTLPPIGIPTACGLHLQLALFHDFVSSHLLAHFYMLISACEILHARDYSLILHPASQYLWQDA